MNNDFCINKYTFTAILILLGINASCTAVGTGDPARTEQNAQAPKLGSTTAPIPSEPIPLEGEIVADEGPSNSSSESAFDAFQKLNDQPNELIQVFFPVENCAQRGQRLFSFIDAFVRELKQNALFAHYFLMENREYLASIGIKYGDTEKYYPPLAIPRMYTLRDELVAARDTYIGECAPVYMQSRPESRFVGYEPVRVARGSFKREGIGFTRTSSFQETTTTSRGLTIDLQYLKATLEKTVGVTFGEAVSIAENDAVVLSGSQCEYWRVDKFDQFKDGYFTEDVFLNGEKRTFRAFLGPKVEATNLCETEVGEPSDFSEASE